MTTSTHRWRSCKSNDNVVKLKIVLWKWCKCSQHDIHVIIPNRATHRWQHPHIDDDLAKPMTMVLLRSQRLYYESDDSVLSITCTLSFQITRLIDDNIHTSMTMLWNRRLYIMKSMNWNKSNQKHGPVTKPTAKTWWYECTPQIMYKTCKQAQISKSTTHATL